MTALLGTFIGYTYSERKCTEKLDTYNADLTKERVAQNEVLSKEVERRISSETKCILIG
jgi:hypothetical protein